MTTIDGRTALLMSVPPLLWAGNAVVGRLVVGSVPPMQLNLLRWLLAAAILLPLGWRALRDGRAIAQRWPHLLLIGTLSIGLYNALQYLALVSTTPVNVTLIAASLPVWMLAVGSLAHRMHPSPRQLAGAALSLAGVAVVVARGELAALARIHFVIGDLYVVLAVISWSVYSWQLARPPASMRAPLRPDWDWAGFLLIQVLFGLVGAAACAAGEAATGAPPIRWNGWVVAALLYVAVGPAILAYRCWGLGIARGGPALAAFFGNLTPVFAALLSAVLLREPPRPFHALAFGLIVLGIVVSSPARRQKVPG